MSPSGRKFTVHLILYQIESRHVSETFSVSVMDVPDLEKLMSMFLHFVDKQDSNLGVL